MRRTDTYGHPCEPRNEMRAGHVETAVQVQHVGGDLHVTYREPASAPASALLVPSQLPAALRTFVDRIEDAEWLTAMIPAGQDGPSIVVLTGLPGIGKAALACWWAQRHRDRFPGGQFYADCGELAAGGAGGAGSGAGGAGAGDIVATFLRSLNVSDGHMPATLHERVSLFRSRTAGAPVLVVLKNVAEAPHVRAVIPNSPGSMVVVTAAGDLGELGLDGALFREVRHLDEPNSVKLLSAFCGEQRLSAESASASSLVRLCAGMPIALTVLAIQLTQRRHLTFAQLVAELSPEDRRLAALSVRGKPVVSLAFSASYDRLPEPARRLYRVLGLLPLAEIGTWAAAAATQAAPRLAGELLGELQSAGLLEERAPGRYGFHELVRLHAREVAQADPGETAESRDAVVQAVVREFLVRAAYADLAIMGKRSRAADHDALLVGQTDPFAAPEVSAAGTSAAERAEMKAAAGAWLDSERGNMVPLVAAAADRGWDAEAWQLAEALVGAYYFNHRRIADWLTVCALGVQAARRCGNDEAEARLRLAASRAHTDRGALDLARDEVDEATRIAERGTDLVLRASAWEFRGRVLEAMGAADEALTAYARSHELNAQAAEWRGAALAGFFSARLLAQAEDPAPGQPASGQAASGQAERALRELRESVDMFRWLGDHRMTGRALIATGILQDRLGHAEQAATILEAAVSELGNAHYAAEALETLAAITERSGDHAGAQRQLRAAWQIYHDAGHPRAFEIAPRLDQPPD